MTRLLPSLPPLLQVSSRSRSTSSHMGTPSSCPCRSTTTSPPSASTSTAGAGRTSTTEGEGAGSAPVHGAPAPAVPAVPSGGSHQGTSRARERGSRPSPRRGIWTAPLPRSDSTRSAARCARRSSSSPEAAHRPAWTEPAEVSSRALKRTCVSGAAGGRPECPDSHPSICQRTRSVSSAGVGTP